MDSAVQGRMSLWIGEAQVGSLLAEDVSFCTDIQGVQVHASCVIIDASRANAALDTIARRFYQAGRLKAWRNELLAVSALPAALLSHGFVLHDLPAPVALLERGAARVLGILTHAVHMVGVSAQGHIYLQQRALNKATDPGLWDTLAGGLLSAGDDLHGGVLRETHEEAGLLEADLLSLRACGMCVQSRVLSDGHILEAVWTFKAQVRGGAIPKNLDGEVMGFGVVDTAQLHVMVNAGQLTQEAVLALRAAGCLELA